MSDQQAILERIRKLLAMTVANGCTEGEAMAAAAKAAKLMAELGLRPGQVEFTEARAKARTGAASVRARLWAIIAEVTNCAVTLTGQRVEFIGRDPWPQVAVYLHTLTDRAINRELAQFKASTWYKRRRTIRAKRAASGDFTAGMVYRLGQTIRSLFAETVSEAERAKAVAERDARWPDAQAVSPRLARGRYFDANLAGARAGQTVPIHHGVAANGGAAVTRIGGPK